MTAARLEDEGGQVEREGGAEVGSTAAVHANHPAEAPNFLAAEMGIYE